MHAGDSGLAEIYAEALDLAARRAEKRAPEAARIEEELESFCEAWRREERLRLFLTSPGITEEAKRKAIRRGLMAASLELVNFLQVLVDRRRIGMIEEIARAFFRRRAEAAGRIEACAIVAREIPAGLRRRIEEALARRYGKKVRLRVETRPGIIGGIILEVGEEVMDGSLKSRIERVRLSLAAVRPGERFWDEGRQR